MRKWKVMMSRTEHYTCAMEVEAEDVAGAHEAAMDVDITSDDFELVGAEEQVRKATPVDEVTWSVVDEGAHRGQDGG